MPVTADQQLQTTPLPRAGRWKLDPAHTTVGFWAKHLGLAKVRGQFEDFAADIIVGDTPETSELEAVIGTASVNTKVQMRDDHIRSADLLDVETHPEIRFRSTSIRPDSDGTWKVDGDLTIRGVTKPATMDVVFNGEVEDPMAGTRRSGFAGSIVIDREDFGINWNGAIEIGGFVGKKIHVEIEAEALLEG